MQLDRTERRILGSLIEKRGSTPDQYPLSLNALVAACNQKSNRDPAMSLEDFEITGCLMGLREKGLVLIRERDGGRVERYAEKLAEHLQLDVLGAAILAELMLRGPQTATELVRRCARMAPNPDLAGIEATLADMARTRLVLLQARQPGQRMARWTHLIAAEEETPESVEESPAPQESPAPPMLFDEPAVAPDPVVDPVPHVVEVPDDAPADDPADDPDDDLRAEIEALRQEVADLRERLERLESVVL